MRRDVEHGPRLHVAVRQGRAGHRRRHGRLYILFADRRTAHRHSHARGDLRIVPDGPAHAHVAQLGRDRRRGGSGPSDACFSVETVGRGAPPAGGGILGDCTPAGRAHAKSFVDFQNDVCADDIRLAVREGMRSIEHVKRYTTTGMASDQGKLSNMNALAIVARALDQPAPVVGLTTFRQPYTPVSFGSFAGASRGDRFDPVRRTPIHDWAAENGAAFEDVGLWKRAWCFPKTGEDMHAASRENAPRRARRVECSTPRPSARSRSSDRTPRRSLSASMPIPGRSSKSGAAGTA